MQLSLTVVTVVFKTKHISYLNNGATHNMSEYEELNPRFKESLLNWMQTKNPFWSLLGMELVEIKKGWAKIRIHISINHNK
jgi:hypothetical protein